MSNISDAFATIRRGLEELEVALGARPSETPVVGDEVVNFTQWHALPVGTVVRDCEGDFWKRTANGAKLRRKDEADYVFADRGDLFLDYAPLTIVKVPQ